MVHATLAISDFMLMLLVSSLWVGGGMLALALAGVGALGGLVLAAWRWRRR